MIENIEVTLRDLLNALQAIKLYDTAHPIFKKSVEKAYLSLQEALRSRTQLVFGIVGEELAFENEILFELSKISQPTIKYLKDRGVERIVFSKGLSQEELEKFVAFLALPKSEAKKDIQDYLAHSGVKNIQAGKLKSSGDSAKEDLSAVKGILGVYENSLKNASQSLSGVLSQSAVDGVALRFSLNGIMDNLASRYQELLETVTLKRYSLETYVHLLNVSILAMYFSAKLGFDKDEVLDIGVAGLFHDIGKLHISRKVLKKTDKLTDEEFAQIKSHTVLGAELLLKYTDSLGILPVVVAFEHHLKYDLSGYPKFPFSQKPHTASLIVSICDVYDALSQRRGYKVDYAPNLIYDIMSKDRGAGFETQLFDKFFRVMGVWPIGAIVALSDSSIAVVRQENEDDIFSPRVEVIAPVPKREIIDLKEKKGALEIKNYLNPWKEGKEYLRLISPVSYA